MKIEVKSENDNITSNMRKEQSFNKIVATLKSDASTQIIDELGLALLLMNIHGQTLKGTDWDSYRGDMYIFADSPTVRSCISLWQKSYIDDDCMSVMERYLYNMLDYETCDAFHDLEEMEREYDESQ